MIAVSGDDIVIVTNQQRPASHNCFLPNVKVTKTPIFFFYALDTAGWRVPRTAEYNSISESISTSSRCSTGCHDGSSRARNRGTGARSPPRFGQG